MWVLPTHLSILTNHRQKGRIPWHPWACLGCRLLQRCPGGFKQVASLLGHQHQLHRLWNGSENHSRWAGVRRVRHLPRDRSGGPRPKLHPTGCWRISNFFPHLSIAMGLSFLVFKMVVVAVGFGLDDFSCLFPPYILICFKFVFKQK